MNVDLSIFCSYFCFGNFAVADIGSCYGVSKGSKPYCLRSYSASAIKYARSFVITEFLKNSLY